MRITDDHNMGCSVLFLDDLDNFYVEDHTFFNNSSLGFYVYSDEGYSDLRSHLRNKGEAGIVVWADSYEGGRSGGEKLYNFLLRRGERVERSQSYFNPSGSPTCRFYTWRFRARRATVKKPAPRSSSPAWRKKVVKKA